MARALIVRAVVVFGVCAAAPQAAAAQRRRIFSVIMIAGAGVLSVLTLPQVSMAQREGTTRSPSERTPLVVRRAGEPDGVRWPDFSTPAPAALTLAQLSQYFAHL